MKIIFQKFDFLSSAYQRPNQTWACGREAEGKPCHLGPDAKGVCRSEFECRPAKRDDRWHCTRSDSAGGRCRHGPFPDGTCCKTVPHCRPVMNWRARPRALAGRVSALVFGLLLIVLAGSAGPGFLNPGPLTFQHGKIDNCGGCHTVFDKGPAAWLHAAFAEKSEAAESKQCLACHDLGRNALAPHSLPPARLAAVSRDVNPPSPGSWAIASASSSMALKLPHEDSGQLPCMTCHQEHRGNTFDLTAMSNQRCMVCHTFQFTSFSDGHSEFFGYPHKRRTRIRFDHARHIGKHFRDPKVGKLAPMECKNCHRPDRQGRTMLVKSFQTVCSTCHDGQVTGLERATAKGLAVLGVPGLDVDTLLESNVAIGGWHEDAEDEITPFMDFLLAADDGYGAVRETLKGLDLLDLSEADDTKIAAVKQLAWRIKELLFDFTVEGVPALKARLEKVLGRSLGNQEMVNLAGLLPMDAMRSAQRAWFPDLYRDVTRYRDGKTVPMNITTEEDADDGNKAPSSAGNDAGDKDGGDLLSGDKDGGDLLSGDKDGDAGKPGDKAGGDGDAGEEAVDLASGENWSAVGGWYREDFSLRYRPTGHGDQFLKAWLDVTGGAGATPRKAAARQIFEELAAPNSPGVCTKCHSIDAGEDGKLAVNWQARRPVADEHPFTAFSHTSHFSLLDEKGCLTCHELNPQAKYLDAFKDRNPKKFISNFKPIERRICAECHTPAEAGDGCLNCHNYHVGNFPPAVASTPKMMSSMGNAKER